MHQQRNPRLSRYSKKSKELFVDFINAANNRNLAPDQLIFGLPIAMSPDGITKVPVKFASTTGFEQREDEITYRRVELSNLLQDMPLTVHVEDYSTKKILEAIYEQWGILIEEEFIFIELIVRDLVTSTPNNDLGGFDTADSEERPVYQVPQAYDNRNYLITFKPDHLIWFGTLRVQTRQSIRLLGRTIDSLMDLREFYRDGNLRKPQVDVYLHDGELKLDDSRMDHKDRRHYESFLYVVKQGEVDAMLPSYLTRLFTILTGDEWVADAEKTTDFNLAGVKVLYNGFTSKEHPVTDHAYNYVIAFELSKLCSNLTGVVKIAYRYSDSLTPGNQPYNRASAIPLFSR